MSDLQVDDILPRRIERVGFTHDIHDDEGINLTPRRNLQAHDAAYSSALTASPKDRESFANWQVCIRGRSRGQ